MLTRVRRVAVAALGAAALTGGVVVVMGTAAGAAPNVNHRHGITISTPHHRTGHNQSRVPIHASVHPRSGSHSQVTGYKIAAFQHHHRVAYGHVLHLRPGAYHVNVHVTYRTWHSVTRTRTVNTRHDPDYGYPDESTCTVTQVSYDWATSARCTSSHYPGQTITESYPWVLEDGDNYVGQRVHVELAGPYRAYYTSTTQHYTARVYGSRHHFTSPKRTLTVVNHTTSQRTGGSHSYASHSCTHTSSGSCIRGGEFCPQSSYGALGYDSSGEPWICMGDTTHPHWE